MEHNIDSEWLKKAKDELRDIPRQEDITITVMEPRRVILRMSDWKAAGPDNVQGKVTGLHG